MLDYLESIDRAIVLAVNSWNTPFWDEVMWVVSSRITWFPLYAFLIFLAFRKAGWKAGILFFVGVGLSVTAADLISTQLFKELIQRYRPSHNLLLVDKLHFYEIKPWDFYRGGDHGFVSSHAANFFAIITFSLLYFIEYRKWLMPLLLLAAALVAFSRVYLGVHYLSDVIVGALLGSLVAFLMYRLAFQKWINKYETK